MRRILLGSILILILSIWSRWSLVFGKEFMDAWSSIHPNIYQASRSDLEFVQHVYGVLFDFFYAVIDSIVFSAALSLLYNRLLPAAGDSSTSGEE